jgi:hypothetical protein
MRRAGAGRPHSYGAYEVLLETAPRMLSAQAFAQAQAEGASWTLDQAIDAARVILAHGSDHL